MGNPSTPGAHRKPVVLTAEPFTGTPEEFTAMEAENAQFIARFNAFRDVELEVYNAIGIDYSSDEPIPTASVDPEVNEILTRYAAAREAIFNDNLVIVPTTDV